MRRFLVFFFISIYSFSFSLRNDSLFNSKFPLSPPFLTNNDSFWVDSILSKMSIEEKIAQSFFVRANSHSLDENEEYFKKVDDLIIKNQIGGLIFFKSNPHNVVDLVNRYQSISKIPLINSIDGEWGVSMRIDSTPFFHGQ